MARSRAPTRHAVSRVRTGRCPCHQGGTAGAGAGICALFAAVRKAPQDTTGGDHRRGAGGSLAAPAAPRIARGIRMKFLLIASFAESLLIFRGPLIQALMARGCHV